MNRREPDVLLIDQPLLDAYTEAYRRGDGGDPESWLKDRSPEKIAGVDTLRTLGLLIRHRDTIDFHDPITSPELSDDDPTPTIDPQASPFRSPIMSDPSIKLDDHEASFISLRNWLRTHQIELLWPLDADKGGMGEIFLAWHQVMKCELVVKKPRNSRNVQRFHREIELHSKLRGHSRIAIARTSMLYWDVPLLIIDYVPGPSLRRHLKLAGRLPWPEATDYVRQAALGLGHAHASGIIHRDVKPGNLVRSVRDGLLSVIDWGLALDRENPRDHDEKLTQAGCTLGTPAYCAPEQAHDPSSATAASDLYGLGCTWFELISGKPPFQGDHRELRKDHARTPVPPLAVELEVPERIEEILRKLLEKKPEHRYQTATELIDALDHALPRVNEKPRVIRRLKPWLSAAAVLILAFLAWRAWPSSQKPAVVDLVIQLSDPSGKTGRTGLIGSQVFEATEGQDLTIRADLTTPAYSYLIAFHPNGRMELCAPIDEFARPAHEASTSYPPSGQVKSVFKFEDGLGLQAFAVVVSRSALPSFQEWKAKADRPHWKSVKEFEPGLVWSSDGRDIKIIQAKAKDDDRGTGHRARGARGAVADLTEWLKATPGVDAVLVKAFAVVPSKP
jgi:serine/threonine protein kinase